MTISSVLERLTENLTIDWPLIVVLESFQDDLLFRTFYSAPQRPRTIFYSVQPSSKRSVKLTNDWQILLMPSAQSLEIFGQSFQNRINGYSSELDGKTVLQIYFFSSLGNGFLSHGDNLHAPLSNQNGNYCPDPSVPRTPLAGCGWCFSRKFLAHLA